MARPAP